MKIAMSKTENNSSLNLIKPGAKCREYPTVIQGSTACQNCRFNRMFGTGKTGEPNKMTCLPHTPQEAFEKGVPNVQPPEHIENWLKKVAQHNAERELAKSKGKEVADE